nr:MAG TPA: repressor protein [Inoviridae sp.]
MEIVERIKSLCITENITIKELERIIQISNGSIRHWNEKTPSVERVLLVADYFKVSLDWLVTGKESGNLTPEEQQLIDYYRKADDRGKRSILRTAESESTELESSASKLG